MTISSLCAQGLHGFCRGDSASCACTSCHLGPCARCGAENLQKMYGELCAGCYREQIRSAPVAPSRCDKCGQAPAFRNPGHRRNELLCTDCHAAAGEPLSLAPSVQGLVADCHGADVSDPRHEWAHVRGNTFGCLRCKIKSYQPELRAQMRRAKIER